MQITKQAIFKLGEEEYGLDIMDVNTIEKPLTIEPVANFAKNLKGIIKLRGDIIPVYSLRRKFGLEDLQPDAETRFMITNSDGILVAYEVDQMTEIAQITEEQLYEIPSVIKAKDTSYIKSVTNIDGRLVIILNHNGILTEDELANIKTVIKK